MKFQHRIHLFIFVIILLFSAVTLVIAHWLINDISYQLQNNIFNKKLTNIEKLISDEQQRLINSGLNKIPASQKTTKLDIIKRLSDYKYHDTGDLYIISRSNNVIFHPFHPKGRTFDFYFIRKMQTNKQGTIEYLHEERQYHSVYRHIQAWNETWLVVLSIETKEIEVLKNDYLRVIYQIMFVIFIFISLLAYFFSQRMMRPLRQTVNDLQIISKGNINHNMVIHNKNDEFGIIQTSATDILKQVAKITESMRQEIRKRNQMKTKLTQAKELAEHANITKSQFIANMSHELRTPLNAIIGYGEMLREDVIDLNVPEIAPDLERICLSGTHLLGLINDILDISKLESGRMELYPETFVVKKIIDDAVATIRPELEKRSNALHLDFSPDIENMFADLTKLKQILLNLLSNATKFCKNGDISIKIDQDINDVGQFIIIQVKDTGIGMSIEEQNRVFDVFVQADNTTTRHYGGTGLGLSISRRFARMMGGNIRVKSEKGVGSTFKLTLPLTASRFTQDE